jgi:hypothetical protein
MGDTLSPVVTPAGMPPTTSSERMRRYRERLAAGEQPQLGQCLACGKTVQLRQQGSRASTDGALLCAACWRKSPAGKAADASRKREARAKAKRLAEQDQG